MAGSTRISQPRVGVAGEEGLREVLGERGGFGSVFCEEVLRVADRAVKVG